MTNFAKKNAENSSLHHDLLTCQDSPSAEATSLQNIYGRLVALESVLGNPFGEKSKSRGKERVVRQSALLWRRERWEPQDLAMR